VVAKANVPNSPSAAVFNADLHRIANSSRQACEFAPGSIFRRPGYAQLYIEDRLGGRIFLPRRLGWRDGLPLGPTKHGNNALARACRLS
jgi:hypothetical protein